MYNSLAVNDFFIAAVTNNHFEPGAYSNVTGMFNDYRFGSRYATIGKEYGDIGYQKDSQDIQLFISMLEGHNSSTPNYEDLTPSQCISLYNTDLLSSHINLFLITNHTSNSTSKDTLLRLFLYEGLEVMQTSWICPIRRKGMFVFGYESCDTNRLASKVASGYPWIVTTNGGEEIEVIGCKSEIMKEKCKVRFSLGIMIAVIGCNLIKVCSMITTVLRSREPTLVTLGDAIDSFLSIPDPTTMGICFADRQFIEREWKHWSRTGQRQWKQNGVQRWWTSASKTRWITCNFCSLIVIIVGGVLLRLGMQSARFFSSAGIISL